MKRILIFLLTLLASSSVSAQQNEAYLQYIETYKVMAMEQMRQYHIPASITLAQGILESNAGRSMLATAANNHFGIKVGSSWTGPYVVKDDDKAGEHFRKYNNPAESYADHSVFLQRSRYSALFTLDPFDYAGWAHGLKAAGYATNPQYPTLLINIIETYNLAQYDRMASGLAIGTAAPGTQSVGTHAPMLCNDVVYIVAREGDSYESLAAETGISARKLRSRNEVPRRQQPRAGDIVYLGKKKAHVARAIRGCYHRVAAGESMHTIAQRYGIRLSKLYKWNGLDDSYVSQVGELLLLK